MKTKAAILKQTNEPLIIHELFVPDLKPGQVLVDVKYSGICQSQLNEWHGNKGPDRFLPHTLGHEGAGEVLQTGAEVTKVKQGDRVVITWIKGSGCDVPSSQYFYKDQVINSGAVSTFMTKAVISENRLVPISDIPMEVAALLGCAVPTGAGMVFNELKPEPGSSIAIWGAGGIGLCSILAAAVSGCNPIIAIDINEEKLALARNCGATHSIVGGNDAIAAVMNITDGQGTDYGIESAGLTATMEQGFATTRKYGGSFLIAGNPPHGNTIKIDPFDLIAGKQIAGSWGGATKPDHDIPMYAKMYRDGKIGLEKLITHSMPFERINEAFSFVENGLAGRVVLDMSSDS